MICQNWFSTLDYPWAYWRKMKTDNKEKYIFEMVLGFSFQIDSDSLISGTRIRIETDYSTKIRIAIYFR